MSRQDKGVGGRRHNAERRANAGNPPERTDQHAVAFNPEDLAALRRHFAESRSRTMRRILPAALLCLVTPFMMLTDLGRAWVPFTVSFWVFFTTGLVALVGGLAAVVRRGTPENLADAALLAHWRYVPERRPTGQAKNLRFKALVIGVGLAVTALFAFGIGAEAGAGVGLSYLVVTLWLSAVVGDGRAPGQLGQVWIARDALCVDGHLLNLTYPVRLRAVTRGSGAPPSLVFKIDVPDRHGRKTLTESIPVPPGAESQADHVQSWFEQSLRSRSGVYGLPE